MAARQERERGEGRERREARERSRAGATTRETASQTGAAASGGGERVCSVAFCPIGLALGALQGAAPEATAHLLRAAQELLLAVRAVLDERTGTAQGSGRLERIEVT